MGGTDRVPIVKQKHGADPSAVLFDTLRSAKARKIDYVIVDTAAECTRNTI